MRVLQISSARSIGGGERHAIDLSNCLARRGHDVFLAASHGSPIIAEMSALPSNNIGIFPLRNALDLTSTTGIAKFVRSNGIELINAHLARDYTIAAAVSLVERVPFVLTRHVLFPMNRLARFFLADASRVIAPSNAVAASLRKEGLFRAEKICTIRYGLDVEEYPERTPPVNASPLVGAIGNLDPVKGFDVLIRAAKLVAEELPAVQFEIVGEDRSKDGRNEVELRTLISQLGLEETVTLSGWSDRTAEKLAAYDLFVSSSRSESFGFVIAEAMLTGVPVVATETEGAKEIISDPSYGSLVPVESDVKLATAIMQALADSDGNKPSPSVRQHVIDNFSLHRMVDETEELYGQVINARGEKIKNTKYL